MTIKDFYEYCVTKKWEDYTLMCMEILKWGELGEDVEVDKWNIHTDHDKKTVILFERLNY